MKEKKFKVLRFIGTLYKILGVIVGLLTILGIVVTFAGLAMGGGNVLSQYFQPMQPGHHQPTPGYGPMMGFNAFGGIMFAVMSIFWGLLIAIMLYGAGEMMYLYLAVEENTRITARLLQNKPLE